VAAVSWHVADAGPPWLNSQKIAAHMVVCFALSNCLKESLCLSRKQFPALRDRAQHRDGDAIELLQHQPGARRHEGHDHDDVGLLLVCFIAAWVAS
jgi:hypothetical protein